MIIPNQKPASTEEIRIRAADHERDGITDGVEGCRPDRCGGIAELRSHRSRDDGDGRDDEEGDAIGGGEDEDLENTLCQFESSENGSWSSILRRRR